MIDSKQVKEWQDQGRKVERIEALLDILKDKFGTLPVDLPSHLQAIGDANMLRELLLKAARAGSLGDFQSQIPNGKS